MKIIALYLPQFHTIPENDIFWGKGFTEWVNMKKAISLFDGHLQPKIPLNDNYYDLSDINVMRWQSELAKKHGVYGFCMYHYWFGGKLLLEKPLENFLKSDIDFNYCISWANEHWTNQWASDNWNVLIEQKYGSEKEWNDHFNYLLKFFNDHRYIKYNGKPVFVIYRPEIIENRKKMLEYWNRLAKKEGFDGICFVFQRAEYILSEKNIDMSMFDFCAAYQPGLTLERLRIRANKMFLLRKLKNKLLRIVEKHFKFDSRAVVLKSYANGPNKYNYDEVWNSIINDEDIFPSIIPCGFTDWDNTPRRGKRGSVMIGANPDKFKNYLIKLIEKAKIKYPTDMIFLFAWNEWAEGGYLEPDKFNGYGYLNAISEALLETKEFPHFT